MDIIQTKTRTWKVSVPVGKTITFTLKSVKCPSKKTTTKRRVQQDITGALPSLYKNYKVIAAKKGDNKLTKVVRSGASFTVKTGGPGSFSLLLVNPSTGSFFGPTICKRSGVKAVMTIKAGASLGMLTVTKLSDATGGYALVNSAISGKVCQGGTAGIVAQAQNGIPIGVGNKGLIKTAASSSRRRLTQQEIVDTKLGNDKDSDGIIDAVDTDVDGNVVLDNLQPNIERPFYAFSNLKIEIAKAFNAYLGNAGTEEAEVTYKSSQTLAIGFADGSGGTIVSRKLGGSSSGLPWLLPGGDASVFVSGSNQAWPDDFNFDATYGGDMVMNGAVDMQLSPGAPLSQVNPGDVIIQNLIKADGSVESLTAPLLMTFKTTPAMVSYRLGASPGTFSNVTYPMIPGSFKIIVSERGDGNVAFRWYRPQRSSITPAEIVFGKFVDIGGLQWYSEAPNYPKTGGGQGIRCVSSEFYSLPLTGDLVKRGGKVVDAKADTPTDPANPSYVQFTLNLKQCIETGGGIWAKGSFDLDMGASSPRGDNSVLKFTIQVS